MRACDATVLGLRFSHARLLTDAARCAMERSLPDDLFVACCQWLLPVAVACCMLKRASQRDHFLMIFELAKRAGWFVDERDRLDHVGFGMVCGEDKKP